MTQETRYLLELFVNFDCDIGSEDITNRMIETLSRIATGKFTKSEHQSMITQGDEYQLRTYAIKILVQLLRSFNNTIEAEQARKKISVPAAAKVDDVDMDEVMSTSSHGAESSQDALAKQRT
jgi:brefeldin A-inhibited guanine nucleotide-exchange protein